eukprot:GHVU01201621.1.p1 GENE.GHVU01201621.1~~GHVU01201621.1.p1  ORF type:complete len:115 (+),score=5.24 GHVU01201621.1:413-757(+)
MKVQGDCRGAVGLATTVLGNHRHGRQKRVRFKQHTQMSPIAIRAYPPTLYLKSTNKLGSGIFYQPKQRKSVADMCKLGRLLLTRQREPQGKWKQTRRGTARSHADKVKGLLHSL